MGFGRIGMDKEDDKLSEFGMTGMSTGLKSAVKEIANKHNSSTFQSSIFSETDHREVQKLMSFSRK